MILMALIIDQQGQRLRNLASHFVGKMTHSKINDYLLRCGIDNLGIPSKTYNNGMYYTTGTNKSDKLYNSFANELNKSKSTSKIERFIEAAYDPTNYNGDKSMFEQDLNELNKLLIMMGVQLNNQGKIEVVKQAKTIDEVEQRLNSLLDEFHRRKLHNEILKYCKKEYLQSNFFHALLEASKGVLQRIRNITSRTEDGITLIDKVLIIKTPLLVFNGLSNDDEENEYKGFRRLLESIVSLVRNPTAHKPKILSYEDFDITMEMFSIISLAHKYLDKCQYTGWSHLVP